MLADKSIDDLIPALVQCFGVIILGYVAGRFELLTDSQAQGLNSYVTKFALPAVFFKVMVSMDFSGVCWHFVAAVSLSKLVVFFIAFLFTLLLSRQCQLGVAGILSMFASQSNDVALGYPVLYSLYPDLASYVYLFAPVQLVVLNPISYIFLEWHKLKSQSQSVAITEELKGPSSDPDRCRPNSCKRMIQVLWRVIRNPIFFMTVIGVIFNFIMHHTIPVYVDGLLRVVAESFTATALFTLGFGMVGKMGCIMQRDIYILVAILMLKLIVCPFVTREFCVQMMSHEAANDSLRYSTFGFLYGAVPTAPPVYLFAVEYQVLPVVVGIGLVLGTFLCAPILFILAHVVTIYRAEPSQYDQLLDKTVVDFSWASIVCCMWTVIILLVSRKVFRIPHRFTVCYLSCVLLSCVGVVVGHFLNRGYDGQRDAQLIDHIMNSPAKWMHYTQFCIFFFGCTGARLWPVLIAFAMVLQRIRGTCFVLRYQSWIFLSGFIMPLLITGVLSLTAPRQLVKDMDPVFQYGRAQLFTSLVVLLISTVGTIACLIWYIRYGSSNTCVPPVGYHSLLPTEVPPSPNLSSDPASTPATDQRSSTTHVEEFISSNHGSDAPAHPQTSLPLWHGYCRCPNSESRRQCIRVLARYERWCNPASSDSESCPSNCLLDTNYLKFQHQRHLILLFHLLATMFFGICLCTWRLVHEDPSGVYLVLEFLDGTFNFGQGLALFVIFGLDAELIIFPIRRAICCCLRKLFGSVDVPKATEPAVVISDGHQEVDRRVNQFVNHHMAACKWAITTEIVRNCRVINGFTAQSFEQWLLDSGLVHSNSEAAEYLDTLLSSRIVVSVPNERFFSGMTSDEDPMSTQLFMFADTAVKLPPGHS